jgi:acylphosphatase
MAGKAEPEERRLHVLVRGRVQGVGFRWFVREHARTLGLAGWVRNRPDGAVEVAASGDDAAVATLRQALERGPDGAQVSAVEDGAGTGETLPVPFAILR